MSEPLVPPQVDLRDFAFMPLDVSRLRVSAIVDSISGEEFRAAILLWCASWHQVPAGSLPDDPRQLSKFAGYGRVVAEWEKVAEGALYGWVKCSDGRWYHPVIAEKAIEAWEKKSEYTERSAARTERAKAAAEAKWGEREPTAAQTRSQRLAEARERGKHTNEEWQVLLALFDNACVRCSASDKVVKDHITPIYQGGSDAIENLQPLCPSCNSSKGPDRTDHRSKAFPNWRESFDKEMSLRAPAETPAKRGEMPAARLLKGTGTGNRPDKETLRIAAREPRDRVPDDIEIWARNLVPGDQPVSVVADVTPIRALLREPGITQPDVEAGIAAFLAKSRKRAMNWDDFERWIRTAAKERIAGTPRARPGARGELPAAIRAPDPEKIRRGLFILACEHFRGRWSDGWSNMTRPGHPDCTTPEDIIEEARLAVELERNTDLQRAERQYAYAS
ncbi:HNH endonuclease [Methylobacterium soli]|uniref:HNH endonuclease n=1 Tax=Methylobacterium soli TaxID=553447 RepID=UPI0017859FE1|nr:HNH endonuclease [Methylobacterium soli]GJE43290.1 hypothetical protein AEGHOMDF_2469 [Methylobacterium soli]